jgi:hypothetical protein
MKRHVNTFALLVLLFAGIAGQAFAATAADSSYSDYVITPAGDTVKGKVLSLRAASVKIDPVNDTHPVVYKFEQVKEICTGGITYAPVISLTGDRKYVFAQRILHGRIDLLVHVIKVKNGELVAYYAGKAGELPIEVRTNNSWPKGFASKTKRRKNLAELLADDPDITRELAGMNDYSPDDLVGMVRRYNQRAQR